MNSRPTILAGNWKMNLRRADASAFADQLRALGPKAAQGAPMVMLFPSAPFISSLSDQLRHTEVLVGAQDLHPESSGAHTGDVSAEQLKSAGATWALCGHSERRHDHNESCELVAAKVNAALASGLLPMVCVGETLEQREAEATESVLAEQVSAMLGACAGLSAEPAADGGLTWALAYEPVWAIGTGLTATPEIAQQAHGFLRQQIAATLGEGAARALPLLYGGSAKPSNCESLIAQADVDGLLIGGASLDSVSFLDMIRRCGS